MEEYMRKMAENSQTYKMELRDLQSLLRKKLGNELVVVKYNTESFLAPGENYGSTMFKVSAVIKKSAGAKDEELELVAKMLPPTEMQRLMFEIEFIFTKEVFFYEEMLPFYKSLEREYGIKKTFDIAPELYGTRLSLKDSDKVDNDAVILMQNLKPDGYYNSDRRTGLDLPHAKVAISAMAHFHALGIAVKQHRPEFFEKIKKHARFPEMKGMDSVKDMMETFFSFLFKDPVTSKHSEKLQPITKVDVMKLMTAPPPEDWSTIVHGDFWINNFMFAKNPRSNEINIKFVDLQCFIHASPLRELVFVLMANLNKEVMQDHFDELVDVYYNKFIDILTKMKCDAEHFSRDKFDKRIKVDAFDEFIHCFSMLKIVTAEVQESEMNNVMAVATKENISPAFLQRVRMCVEKYVEKGWL